MDEWRPDRAAKKVGMPASSILLASAFHASIVFALLGAPLAKTPASIPDDAIELTIERQIASAATVVEPVVPPELRVEPAPAPALESAVPQPEPAPQLTLRDFPEVEPVIAKTEQKKPAPAPDPKPPSTKAPVPAPTATPQTASPPAPPSSQADVDASKKDERAARLWGTKYFERMGIRPSHQATLTGKSGRACPLDPEPYKLEIADNKFTATNDYGVMFIIAVPADGEIYQLYKRPPMAGDHIVPGKWMEYKMIGNVKTGKLVIWAANCVYTLNLY